MPNPEPRDIPSDNGARARIDPRTGEVHGSGVGAGGGSTGEDFSSDSATGDGQPENGIDVDEDAE